jgi:hypothetical protein
MLLHRRRKTNPMKKLWSLVLVSAALCIALPSAASAHDYHGNGHGHGHGWHGPHGYWHGAAFVPVPVPVPVAFYPAAYYPAPRSVYTVPCQPAPVYYPAAAPVPAGPFLSVRAGHVAVSIGGFYPY